MTLKFRVLLPGSDMQIGGRPMTSMQNQAVFYFVNHRMDKQTNASARSVFVMVFFLFKVFTKHCLHAVRYGFLSSR